MEHLHIIIIQLFLVVVPLPTLILTVEEVPVPPNDKFWQPNIIDEGPCIDPNPNTAAFEQRWLLQSLKADWYVTLASRLYIYTYTKLTTGEPKTTDEYLNKLCLKFTPGSPVYAIVGLQPTSDTEINCNSDKLGEQYCNVRNITNPKDEKLIKSVATWTDNEQYIFMTLCLPDGKKAWILLENEKPGNISETNKYSLEAHILSFRFNPDLAYSFNYDLCHAKEITTTPTTTISATTSVPIVNFTPITTTTTTIANKA